MIELILMAAVAGAPATPVDARAELAAKLPGVEAQDIRESPVPGLYEVMVGARIVYVSADGRFLLNGQMIDLENQANVTESRLSDVRARWISGLDESRMVIFEPTGATRHTVTVFTDIDCGFCRTMHEDIDGLRSRGVRVRYLLYPRNGPGTESAKKADHVWCSADRNEALTRAKAGKRVTAPACETPTIANFELGRSVPVTGTPTLITDGGMLIPGYLETAKLVAELDRLKALQSPRTAEAP
ncbi:MAG: DsbC family protein [Gammaproteobacteria bacterium]